MVGTTPVRWPHSGPKAEYQAYEKATNAVEDEPASRPVARIKPVRKAAWDLFLIRGLDNEGKFHRGKFCSRPSKWFFSCQHGPGLPTGALYEPSF